MTLQVPPPSRAFLADGAGAGAVLLLADGSLRIAGVEERAWTLEVSGYRVMYRWLAARNGEALDATLLRGVLDLVWRITELYHLFDGADSVLDRAVKASLSRADLGLPPPTPGLRARLDTFAEETDEHATPA